MIKVFWQQSRLFLGTIEEDNAYEFWWADVGPFEDFHINILPTNIIRGNPDFGKKDVKYIFLVSHGVSIGHSSSSYNSVDECKAAAESFVNATKTIFDMVEEPGRWSSYTVD